ncbi:hypothetical protein tpqmel_0049, partial [Candidatus Gastranaerophilus sp. (ex Termes propinquus)]
SKKIPEERKPFLMIDAVATTLVTSAVAILIDEKSKPITETLDKTYRKLKPALDERKYLNRKDTFETMKSMTIFSTVVRYAVPVLMVPVIGAMVNKLNESKAKKADAQAALLNTNANPFPGKRSLKQPTPSPFVAFAVEPKQQARHL